MSEISSYIWDRYSIFPSFWESIKHLPIPNQIEKWDNFYMGKWPRLRNFLKKKYKEEGQDWFTIAQEFVFPKFNENVDEFQKIGDILQDHIPNILKELKKQFKVDFEILFIIYVGIGLGAGWATEFDGKPAILFGIENAAECGWNRRKILEPLIAHELGHILHHFWRKQNNLPIFSQSPLWTLYEEGFAMRIEHRIMGYESWHEQQEDKGWLLWCQMNQAWLSEEFLKKMMENSQESLRPFFGSWYDIKGMKQTGYYLGHEIIKHLEKQNTLQEIANFSLSKIERSISETLEVFANKL